MERGYIKLWRKSLNTNIFDNPEVWQFWCWCLMKAAYKDHTIILGFQEVPLMSGQFVFGRAKAAAALKTSERKIRTCLNLLKTTNNITIKTTNKFSIITIINWELYQSNDFIYDQQINQQNDQPATSKRPANDQQATTNKNSNKNVKNVKKKIYTDDFLKFWECYPKKIGKDAAFKAWHSRNGDRPDIAMLIVAVEKQKTMDQWIKDGGQFIPNPSTWLNQGRWADEIKDERNDLMRWAKERDGKNVKL